MRVVPGRTGVTTCCPLYCLVCSMNSTKDQQVSSPATSELAMVEREETLMPAGAAHRDSETAEQREQWLRKPRMRDRARCAA